MQPLLEIKNLTVEFRSGGTAVPAVDDVSLVLRKGETLGLVGESGCGKTVTALSVGRLVPCPPGRYSSGEILVEGKNVLQLSERELRQVRGGKVSYVFQEPGTSLNPVYRIEAQLLESLKLHRPERANKPEVVRLLKLVGIPAPELRARAYPFQLSGGMQQRVMIAMALASEPQLLIADEPTTSLDVTIQAQIIELLRDLKARLSMAILLITHNLALVGELADQLAVMYAGQIVEWGPAPKVLGDPLHPYTKALLGSVPTLQSGARRLTAIPGAVPRGGLFPPGCRFFPRCPSRRRECESAMPPLIEAAPGRWVRSFYWGDVNRT